MTTTVMMIEGDGDMCAVPIDLLTRVRIGGDDGNELILFYDRSSISIYFHTASKCTRAYNKVTSAWKNLQASKRPNAED